MRTFIVRWSLSSCLFKIGVAFVIFVRYMFRARVSFVFLVIINWNFSVALMRLTAFWISHFFVIKTEFQLTRTLLSVLRLRLIGIFWIDSGSNGIPYLFFFLTCRWALSLLSTIFHFVIRQNSDCIFFLFSTLPFHMQIYSIDMIFTEKLA